MDGLVLRIDASSGVAPFEQVKAAIIEQVDTGVLTPGHRLPPLRTLATSLDLAANTVARAYKELEGLGVVETRGRAGTFVAGRGVGRAARQAVSAYLTTTRSLGLSDAEAIDLVRRASDA